MNANFQDNTFYPITFPVTVGPGCIVVMLTLSAHATESTLSGNLLARAGLLLAAAVLAVLVYLAGRMPKRMYADPSSPLAGLI